MTGLFGWLILCAEFLGSCTGTPATSKGAVTMKITRRTSMTSTIGVTLMSAMIFV